MSEQLPPPDDARDDARDHAGDEALDDVRAVDDAPVLDKPAEPAEPADAPRAVDADAWATACAEDLEAEKARRRDRHGPPPGSAAEELKRLVDAVADKLSGLQSPLFGAVAGPAAQQVVRQVVEQAKAAVEPVIERNPDVFDHLAAAGNELLAAYRSAVQDQERRWTSRGTAESDPRDIAERRDRGDRGDRGDESGSGSGERIDLD
ncbi:DUF5304 domain-containing protein [Streptomyces sp. 15-116A]|uniref:DUF5304 domain-containing protein n=1 Tax=Streptomyces sp. 15-116A TaxID=2259035 RepID=UPI0021B45A00|nr:DUF5304 domain-containing protein [Streptomyces sp. 15-116A]MCT7357140.1 DUF5304 domain-containing protein [Streptomyces sp. 15-116A]